MVRIITIRTSGDMIRATKSLNRMKKNLPKMSKEAMRKWGKTLERDVKSSAKNANITPYSGKLFNDGIKYKQGKNSKIGALFVAQYGVYLDSMPPHYVNITRSRTRFMAWGNSARNESIRKGSAMVGAGKIKSYTIYVRPHPFILNGYRRARTKLSPELRRAVSLAVNSS